MLKAGLTVTTAGSADTARTGAPTTGTLSSSTVTVTTFSSSGSVAKALVLAATTIWRINICS